MSVITFWPVGERKQFRGDLVDAFKLSGWTAGSFSKEKLLKVRLLTCHACIFVLLSACDGSRTTERISFNFCD